MKSIFDFPAAQSQTFRRIFGTGTTVYSCPGCYRLHYRNEKIQTKEGIKTICICKACKTKFRINS